MHHIFTITFLAVVLFSGLCPLASAQTCSDAEQLQMNTCVGDGVDTCHSTYMYCKRQVQEVSDFRGLALEDCCCTNGAPESQASFRACRRAKVADFKQAKELFTSSFYSAGLKALKRITFANCNFGCDY